MVFRARILRTHKKLYFLLPYFKSSFRIPIRLPTVTWKSRIYLVYPWDRKSPQKTTTVSRLKVFSKFGVRLNASLEKWKGIPPLIPTVTRNSFPGLSWCRICANCHWLLICVWSRLKRCCWNAGWTLTKGLNIGYPERPFLHWTNWQRSTLNCADSPKSKRYSRQIRT